VRRALARLLVTLALVVVAPPAPEARSQTQEARAAELDAAGRDAFRRGDFAGAGKSFDEADRLAPHAELRYNAALAWDRAGDFARAADGYEGALGRGGLDAERSKRAGARLAAMKERLAYVRVPAPLGGVLSTAHLTRAPIPVSFHLVPGEHIVRVERADGQVISRTISVRAGEISTLELGAEGAEPIPVPATGARATPPEPDNRAPTSPATIGGIVALGGAAVFTGGAIYFGVDTLRARDEYDESGHQKADARDRGVRSRALANVAIGASFLCTGVGVYLLILGARSKGGRAAGASLTMSASGAAARLAF